MRICADNQKIEGMEYEKRKDQGVAADICSGVLISWKKIASWRVADEDRFG